MNDGSLVARAEKVLTDGLLKPDERNLSIFIKLVGYTAFICCISFAAGFSASWHISRAVVFSGDIQENRYQDIRDRLEELEKNEK